MSGVYLSSSTNSQMFTTCCQTAICDTQEKFPACKKYVYPFDESMSAKDRDEYSSHDVFMTRWNRAYGPRRTK